MLHALSLMNQTCLATIPVADCEKLLQKVEKSSTLCNIFNLHMLRVLPAKANFSLAASD